VRPGIVGFDLSAIFNHNLDGSPVSASTNTRAGVEDVYIEPLSHREDETRLGSQTKNFSTLLADRFRTALLSDAAPLLADKHTFNNRGPDTKFA